MSYGKKRWKRKKSGKSWRNRIKGSFAGEYSPLSPQIKTLIVAAILLFTILVPVIADYEENSHYPGTWGYTPPIPPAQHQYDPFTTIWNGQTSSSNPNTIAQDANSQVCGPTNNVASITCPSITATQPDELVILECVVVDRGLVVAICGTPTGSSSPTQGITWVPISSASFGGACPGAAHTVGCDVLSLWYLETINAAPETVTPVCNLSVAGSGSPFPGESLECVEWTISGENYQTPIDASVASTLGSSTTFATQLSTTNALSHDLVIGAFGTDYAPGHPGSSTYTAGCGSPCGGSGGSSTGFALVNGYCPTNPNPNDPNFYTNPQCEEFQLISAGAATTNIGITWTNTANAWGEIAFGVREATGQGASFSTGPNTPGDVIPIQTRLLDPAVYGPPSQQFVNTTTVFTSNYQFDGTCVGTNVGVTCPPHAGESSRQMLPQSANGFQNVGNEFFSGFTTSLTAANFGLWRFNSGGSLGGTLKAQVYLSNTQSSSISALPTGTSLGDSATISATSLSTSPDGWVQFTFSSPVTLARNTYYFIILNGESLTGANIATGYVNFYTYNVGTVINNEPPTDCFNQTPPCLAPSQYENGATGNGNPGNGGVPFMGSVSYQVFGTVNTAGEQISNFHPYYPNDLIVMSVYSLGSGTSYSVIDANRNTWTTLASATKIIGTKTMTMMEFGAFSNALSDPSKTSNDGFIFVIDSNSPHQAFVIQLTEYRGVTSVRFSAGATCSNVGVFTANAQQISCGNKISGLANDTSSVIMQDTFSYYPGQTSFNNGACDQIFWNVNATFANIVQYKVPNVGGGVTLQSTTCVGESGLTTSGDQVAGDVAQTPPYPGGFPGNWFNSTIFIANGAFGVVSNMWTADKSTGSSMVGGQFGQGTQSIIVQDIYGNYFFVDWNDGVSNVAPWLLRLWTSPTGGSTTGGDVSQVSGSWTNQGVIMSRALGDTNCIDPVTFYGGVYAPAINIHHTGTGGSTNDVLTVAIGCFLNVGGPGADGEVERIGINYDVNHNVIGFTRLFGNTFQVSRCQGNGCINPQNIYAVDATHVAVNFVDGFANDQSLGIFSLTSATFTDISGNSNVAEPTNDVNTNVITTTSNTVSKSVTTAHASEILIAMVSVASSVQAIPTITAPPQTWTLRGSVVNCGGGTCSAMYEYYTILTSIPCCGGLGITFSDGLSIVNTKSISMGLVSFFNYNTAQPFDNSPLFYCIFSGCTTSAGTFVQTLTGTGSSASVLPGGSPSISAIANTNAFSVLLAGESAYSSIDCSSFNWHTQDGGSAAAIINSGAGGNSCMAYSALSYINIGFGGAFNLRASSQWAEIADALAPSFSMEYSYVFCQNTSNSCIGELQLAQQPVSNDLFWFVQTSITGYLRFVKVANSPTYTMTQTSLSVLDNTHTAFSCCSFDTGGNNLYVAFLIGSGTPTMKIFRIGETFVVGTGFVLQITDITPSGGNSGIVIQTLNSAGRVFPVVQHNGYETWMSSTTDNNFGTLRTSVGPYSFTVNKGGEVFDIIYKDSSNFWWDAAWNGTYWDNQGSVPGPGNGAIPIVNGDSLNEVQCDGACVGTTIAMTGILFAPALIASSIILNDPSTCPATYKCLNAKNDNIGNIQLYPSWNKAAVALSTSAIDLSQSVSKAIGFAENVLCNPFNGTTTNACVMLRAGDQFGWFLTVNDTLPAGFTTSTINTNGTSTSIDNPYNILNDQSVVIAFQGYVSQNLGGNQLVMHWYLYMQRQVGQQLILASGQYDPYPSCPTSGTLYTCQSTQFGDSTHSPVSLMDAVLNFTGGGGGSNPSNVCYNSSAGLGLKDGGASCSYICVNNGANVNAQECDVGGAGNFQVTYTNTNFFYSFLQPWLGLQNQYYMGFWQQRPAVGMQMNNASIVFQTSPCSGSGTCSGNNVVSFFVPASPCNGGASTGNIVCIATQSSTDTGGFAGWVGRALGGAWSAITGPISNLAAPIFAIGNSLLGVFISALLQAGNLFVQGFIVVFNAIGTLIGDSHLGNDIVQFFVNFIKFFTLFFTNLATDITDLINYFISAISFVFGAFILAVLAFEITMVGLLITLATIIITVLTYVVWSFPMILFIDYIYGMIEVYLSGLSGFLGWIDFNIRALSILIKAFLFIYEEIEKRLVSGRTIAPRPLGT